MSTSYLPPDKARSLELGRISAVVNYPGPLNLDRLAGLLDAFNPSDPNEERIRDQLVAVCRRTDMREITLEQAKSEMSELLAFRVTVVGGGPTRDKEPVRQVVAQRPEPEEIEPAPYNYDVLDIEARIVVQQRTSEIRGLVSKAAQDIRDIGLKLAEVKQRLPHGHFLPWLRAEFGLSERMARNFMQVGEQFKSANFADLKIAPSALYLLAAPSTPEEARTEAMERAGRGETITHGEAKRIVYVQIEKSNFSAMPSTPTVKPVFDPNEKPKEYKSVQVVPTASKGGTVEATSVRVVTGATKVEPTIAEPIRLHGDEGDPDEAEDTARKEEKVVAVEPTPPIQTPPALPANKLCELWRKSKSEERQAFVAANMGELVAILEQIAMAG